jgi:hypothetical protein
MKTKKKSKNHKKAENERTLLIKELYKSYRINFKRRRLEVKGLSDLIVMDLADLAKLSRFNNGYSYILLVVNAFSRKIYCEAIKKKTGKETADALLKILKRMKLKIKNCHSDFGKEFFNSEVRERVMRPKKINHYKTQTGQKAFLAERLLIFLLIYIYIY